MGLHFRIKERFGYNNQQRLMVEKREFYRLLIYCHLKYIFVSICNTKIETLLHIF